MQKKNSYDNIFYPTYRMKRFFITFADSKLKPTLERIGKQAGEMNLFDNIRLFSEKKLPNDFRTKYRDRLAVTSRGYGYWIWKPYIISQTLEEMEDGDQLLYLDAGCHLNPQGRIRLIEYFDALALSESKIAGFALPHYHNESRWTKMDLIAKLGLQNNEEILKSAQIAATNVFIQKSQKSEDFVKTWMRLADDLHLVDDSPSVIANSPDFVEHRHDQSIFSLLCKKNKALIFPYNEVYPYNETAKQETWRNLSRFPIHNLRDKKFSRIGKIQFLLSLYIKKILNL